MRRLAWLGAGFAAGVAFALPRVLDLEGELEACDDADRDPEQGYLTGEEEDLVSPRPVEHSDPWCPPPGAEFVEHNGYLYPVDPMRPWVLVTPRDSRGLPVRRRA